MDRSALVKALRAYVRRQRILIRSGLATHSEQHQFNFRYSFKPFGAIGGEFKLKRWVRQMETCIQDGKDVVVCSCCGKVEVASYGPETNQRMVENEVCFGCDLWKSREATLLGSCDVYICGRDMISVGRPHHPNADKSVLGHGGREMHIIDKNGKVVATSNNMWNGGEVPAWLLSRVAAANPDKVDNYQTKSIDRQEYADFWYATDESRKAQAIGLIRRIPEMDMEDALLHLSTSCWDINIAYRKYYSTV